MADESDNGSFESRLGKALDSIDGASRKLEKTIKEKLDKKQKSENSVSRDFYLITFSFFSVELGCK